MTSEKNRLYAGAAIALAIAAGIGFGIARLTQPVLPAPEAASAKADTPKDSVVITAEGIRISKIGIAPAAAGGLDAAISASATVDRRPTPKRC
jgi:cobalt-zinc-cadmium efflux system membrane fusion protein